MLAIALFAFAFAVRALVGALFAGPAYPDSYYYAHVAQQLAAGHGLVTQYVWNLDDIGGALPALAVLPTHANGYWTPLAELIQLPSIWLLGPGPLASVLPFWLIGALAAPLTYLVGRDVGLARGAAIAAGLMVAAPAGLTPFMSQPDNFGLFMTLGVLALWLCARGSRGERRAFAMGGLVVGLATLARPDGVLLGLPFALVGVREIWRVTRGRPATLGWSAAVACAALFLVVVAPWLLRQLEVFGTILPGGRTLWLTDYQQLFSFERTPTAQAWLDQGVGPLLASRVDGLLAAVGLFTILPLAVVLAPFAVIGTWVHRSNAMFRPFYIYAVALFGVMILAFAVLVPHGTFIHAASALLPHTFLLVVAGTAAAVDWVAARRPTWSAPTATRLFSATAVAVALLAAAVQTVTTTRHWAEVRAVHAAVAAGLADAPPGDRFMAVDPGAINYLTGRQGIITPHDELPVIERVLRAYDVRWLVLESNSVVPSLAPVLAGTVHPGWLSRPVAIVADDSATHATLAAAIAPPPSAVPAAALYAVCLSAVDTRCAR